jgi:uracil-DNA glycosylase
MVERGLRTQLEMFSLSQNKLLIRAIKPKQILLLGWDTLELMGGIGFRELVANEPVHNRPRRKRLLQSGKIDDIPAFAIPHPSAAWKNPPVTDEDWRMIAAGLGATDQIQRHA